MKNRKWYLELASLALVTLVACGGGGGGDSPVVTPPVSGGTTTVVVTPTTYTATTLCASGPALTSTVSQAAANALVPSACPALPASAYAATSVVVGSGTLTISVSGLPSGFTSGVLTATKFTPDISVVWDLIPTTTGNASATLRSGSSALGFATGYAGLAEMNFVGAPSASKTITFTTPAVPVAFAWPTDVKTLIEPAVVNGVLVSSALAVRNWLPLNPVTNIVGDAAWNANLANGNVQIVKSGEMAPDINGVQRNIWRAVYSYVNGNGRVNCISPIYADTGLSYVNDNAVGTTCFLSLPAYVTGVNDATQANNGTLYRGGIGSLTENSCFLITITSAAGRACPF